ncbi:MAG: ABC transporter permease, partial [Nocardioides sp.]|uniref:ABC transporter permease n=1 Tax=Nocardioides sp. TaxID=35761 RepID=UPI003265F904
MTTQLAPPVVQSDATATRRRRPGLGSVLRWELRKLRAQRRTLAVLIGALVLPIVVVVVMHGQSRPPKDTLFGRFAIDNGFAMALLILGFASQWVLPLLTAIVAGDIFASEDQHGTWKTVLTRSASRGQLFWAKTLAAMLFA